MKSIKIDGNSLKINDVIEVSNNYILVELSKSCLGKITKSRKTVDRILNSENIVYGINTGFGTLASIKIKRSDTATLQENLIKSHAVGVGASLSKNIVRAMMLLRANALAKGFSGVRPCLIEKLLELLNKDVYPYIPSQGSVGASGDLAPLSHLALVLIGDGECIEDGKRTSTKNIFKNKNISPIVLEAKEGLGLINGTQMMSALASHVVFRAYNLLSHAILGSAMSLEALRGTDKAFDERIQNVRPHIGQIRVAEILREFLKDSENLKDHKNCSKVQDAYTLRCIPQILGPVLDTINYVSQIIETEINSATDNPLIFDDDVISGGNFHGECLALAMDFIKIALSEIGSHSERLTERLVNPALSGLPAFLIKNSGLNSGLMIAQYTAAALVSEDKVLAHPASVDSIPTSANQEDHVSMGSIASMNALKVLENVEKIVSINLICAAQGIDFLDKKPSKIVLKAHEDIRKLVSFIDKDRELYLDLEKIIALIINKRLDSIKNFNFSI